MRGLAILLGVALAATAKDPVLASDIEYYEVRGSSNKQDLVLRREPSLRSPGIAVLQPGWILQKVEEDETLARRALNEKYNQGRWLQVGSVESPLYFWDHWRTTYLLRAEEQPVQLQFEPRLSKKQLMVFAQPGYVEENICQSNPSLCVGRVTLGTDIILLATEWHLPLASAQKNTKTSPTLFYNVEFAQLDEQGIEKLRRGWVWAGFVERQPTFQPVANAATLSTLAQVPVPSTVKLLPPDTRNKLQRFGRWTGRPGLIEPHFKIDKDFGASYGFQSIRKTGLTQSESSAHGTKFLFALTAPILWDFEAAATFDYFLPLKETQGQTRNPPHSFNFEQLVSYNFPLYGAWSYRAGVGWHISALLNVGSDYGYQAIVGARGVLVFDSPRYSFSFRGGPVGNAAGLDARNHVFIFEALYRFYPQRGYQSWGAMLEVSETYVKSPMQKVETQQYAGALGVRRAF